jgi:hypothetical protein
LLKGGWGDEYPTIGDERGGRKSSDQKIPHHSDIKTALSKERGFSLHSIS